MLASSLVKICDSASLESGCLTDNGTYDAFELFSKLPRPFVVSGQSVTFPAAFLLVKSIAISSVGVIAIA